MADIVQRLTHWRDDPADLRDEPESAALLMAEAAGVIDKLRQRLRLLDAAIRSQPLLADEGIFQSDKHHPDD
jgi:hypothetical protein